MNFRFCVFSLVATGLILGFARPDRAGAECKEFKIVEYEDRVEAVCVGEPLTEAQKKADQEEQKRLDQEAHRKRVEEQNRQKEEARASKAREDSTAEAERKKRTAPPVGKPTAPDRNMINMKKF